MLQPGTASTLQSPRRPRIPELDAARGLAALTIVLFHMRFTGLVLMGSAVDLFFVLSGYLITRILLERPQTRHSLKSFYAGRALRIWPIYYLMFPVLFVINPLLPRPQPLDGLPYYLTYTQFIQEYWGGTVPPFSRLFRHTWTLAIEEQFYLFWPLVVCLIGRRFLWVAILPLVLAPTVVRSWNVFPHLLVTRCDGLGLGALLAWISHGRERPGVIAGRSFVVVTLAALSYPIWRIPIVAWFQQTWPEQPWQHLILPSLNALRISVLYFGVVGLLLCHSGHWILKPLRDPWLCYLGRISYGLYLYHPFVFTACTLILIAMGVGGSALIDVGKLAVLIGVAALSWTYIEQPILSLRDRWTDRGARLDDIEEAGRAVLELPPGGAEADGRRAVA